MSFEASLHRLLATLLPAVALLSVAPAALADVPSRDIATPGPLTHVYVGNELSCQVAHTRDTAFELFPSAVEPGDCGTFLAVGEQLYAPNFPAHQSTATGTASLGPRTFFTPVSQTPVMRSGSRYRVVTVVRAGAFLITQTDTYRRGDESYRTDTTVANTGSTSQNAILYRAGDCFLQGSDVGFGFREVSRGAVGCSVNPNNRPRGRIEEWLPITPGNNYFHGQYEQVWARIGTRAPFPNTCRCTERLDNGAGISWNLSIPAGGRVTRSHYTTFSPRGVTGGPDRRRPTVRVSGVPRACTSSGFTARVSVSDRSRVTTSVLRDGRRIRRTSRKRFRVRIGVAGLRAGRHTISVVARDAAGNSRRRTVSFGRCGQPTLTG
jgi:hypothetical protein